MRQTIKIKGRVNDATGPYFEHHYVLPSDSLAIDSGECSWTTQVITCQEKIFPLLIKSFGY
jgi:hypothetical protein